MEQKTVKDVLTDVNQILNELNIPAKLVESLGIPIARCINGIQMCIDAIAREEQEQAAKAQEQPQDEKEEEQEDA